MKKRLYIIILLMVAFVLPSNAVLKEANLDTTLYMLRTELTNYHIDLEKQNQAAKAQQLAVIQELISIVKQADQNSIMLYSQRNGYIFDMTYACHEATEQFKKFKSKAVPFRPMSRLTTEPTVSYRHSTTMPTADTKISRTASSLMEATTICAYSVTSA